MVQVAERKALSESLQSLTENMRTLAELSGLAIRKATDIMLKVPIKDGEADAVFTLDREIYGLQQKIVESCVETIALHAPVARDLRTITTSLEIATDFDRIGRYSKDIVEAAIRIHQPNAAEDVKVAQLARMAELTIGMVNTAIDAFLKRDADSVVNINEADDAVDHLHDRVFLDVVDRMADRTLPPAEGAEYILMNRYFERISDHAVSIGQHVVYMVTGRRPYRLRNP